MAVAAPSRWFRRRPLEDRALTRENVPTLMLAASQVPGISPRSALSVSDAYACIRALADSAASLPLHVYRRTDAGREWVEGGAAEPLRSPAAAVTQAALVAQMVGHLNLFGEAFVGKYRDQTGAVFQLGLLAPDRVQVEMRGGMPTYGYADENGRYGVYTTADVIHVRGLSVDGLRGVSPVRQASRALGYAGSLAEHGARFMANGARPAGVLSVPPGPAAEEVMENLRKGWEARHRGPENAGRIAVLSGEVSFAPLTMPMDDAEFLGQREFSTREVARIFRVPPWIIGAQSGDSLTYATVAEQARAFVTFSLRPWLCFIEQALGGDVELVPPTMKLSPAAVRVAEFFQVVAGLRLWAGDDRPVPFGCDWVASRLDMSAMTVWRAREALVAAGVIQHAGALPGRGKLGTDSYSPVAATTAEVIPIRRAS
jgi:HK97 family phage portal protein